MFLDKRTNVPSFLLFLSNIHILSFFLLLPYGKVTRFVTLWCLVFINIKVGVGLPGLLVVWRCRCFRCLTLYAIFTLFFLGGVFRVYVFVFWIDKSFIFIDNHFWIGSSIFHWVPRYTTRKMDFVTEFYSLRWWRYVYCNLTKQNKRQPSHRELNHLVLVLYFVTLALYTLLQIQILKPENLPSLKRKKRN